MTQGRITTVSAHEAHTEAAEDYTPIEVNLSDTVAAHRQTLERPSAADKSAIATLWQRMGKAIKRYFTYNPEGKRPRVWELDVMRGIILLCVTLDHCCTYGQKEALMPTYTVVGEWLKHVAGLYCDSAVRHAMQPFGLWLLAFMSGMNGAFTRSKFHRVAKFWVLCALFMGGYAVLHIIWSDLVTASLIFNIIAVLTICFTFWWILDIVKCPYWLRSYLGALLIVIGLTYYYLYYIADNATVQNAFLSLMVYNEHGRSLSPQNFEPLLPHMGFFLVGGVLGKYLYADKKTKCKRELPPKALTPILLVGKHSLAAYLVLPFLLLGIARGIVAIVGLCV